MRVLMVLFLALATAAHADTVPGAAEALNAFRADRARGPLQLSKRLQTMADRHARDMARRGYLSHRGPGGATLRKRARRVGYDYCKLAENIAKGHGTLGTVLDDWASSGGHRKNLLRKDVTEFGLARAPGDIWVMVLGRSGC